MVRPKSWRVVLEDVHAAVSIGRRPFMAVFDLEAAGPGRWRHVQTLCEIETIK